MADVIPADEQSNYETFRDCLSEPVMKALALPDEKPKPKKKRIAKKGSKEKNDINGKSKETEKIISSREAKQTDAEELGDFIEVHLLPCISNTATLTIHYSTSAVSSSPASP